jgi:bis(5'-nucleosyl)-tetraphosphatase (symmetrical)
VTCYAIGDVQGCYDELRTLIARVNFSADRDRLWFVGDLVNRGPRSLETLRFVRSLGDNAVVVLGNHDLHLLAVAFGSRRKRRSDTLDEILEAHDRDRLLEWLVTRPLLHFDPARRDLLVHAGLVPQWNAEIALSLAREVETSLRKDPREVFDHMYGDEPDRWSESLTGPDRQRFTINVLTRLRLCTAQGQIDLRMKGKPQETCGEGGARYRPWFQIEARRSRDVRIVFGHWSALGLVLEPGVIGLDTGCVWGNALTAYDLDEPGRPPICVPCGGYLSPDAD